MLNEALRQSRYAGDPAWSSDALFALGTAYTGTADFARSAAAHFEAAGLFRQAGQEDWAALALESAEVALREAARHRGPRGLWRRLRTRFRRR
ncbi:hypothetical protein D1J60_00440 [Streptomyces sp. W1SF4]|nr:hypothetical protein D1J60_00440 [Streptomyces sp. W1SF4]